MQADWLQNSAKNCIIPTMKILSIETSCDETAISIVDSSDSAKGVKFDVLANIVLSQAKLHAEYGGVFPNLAKREHAKNLIPVLKEALTNTEMLKMKENSKNETGTGCEGEAFAPSTLTKLNQILEREQNLLKQFTEFISKIEIPEIDTIAVTNGPGLEPALWVGVNFAKALSIAWNIPIIPVNHMEGHILGALLTKEQEYVNTTKKLSSESHFTIAKFELPAIALLISGGHTQLILMSKNDSDISWNYKIIGETRDDAVGEAFDKVARMLELPYPGGPEISKIAETATQNKNTPEIKLPRPMIDTDDFDFSFSGLKTAVLYMVKKLPKLTEKIKASVALEFEKSVTDVLIKKTLDAVSKHKANTIIIGGGVSANKRIRNAFEETAKENDIKLFVPNKELSTDNALMISIAGYFKSKTKNKATTEEKLSEIHADGNLSL